MGTEWFKSLEMVVEKGFWNWNTRLVDHYHSTNASADGVFFYFFSYN